MPALRGPEGYRATHREQFRTMPMSKTKGPTIHSIEEIDEITEIREKTRAGLRWVYQGVPSFKAAP